MKTILLVDTDSRLLEQLGAHLRQAGWTVWQATDGVTAMELAVAHRPNVLVSDLLLPRTNGFQLYRQLRERKDILAGLRIITISGSVYPTDRTNAMEAGADVYLLKPIYADELLQHIGAANVAPAAPEPAAPASSAKLPRVAATGIEAGPVRVKFWGVRGSIATPGPDTLKYGGNTSCVEVRADGELIVMDAGTGIRSLGRSLVKEFQGRPVRLTLLVSHTHWDHIQGFPFFIPAYNPKNEIRILGCEGAKSGLDSILSSQMESPYFPISMRQMPGHLKVDEIKEFHFDIGPVAVEAMYLNHPGLCLGFRLNTSAGSIVYLPDNEPFSRLRTIPKRDYDSLAFAQQQDARLVDFIQNADVLIMDSQYDDAEYQTHVGWGHGCLDDVVALALIAKVKRLYLFHHDPDHDDEHISRMQDWARELVAIHGETLHVEAAQEGVEIVLTPEPAPSV